MQMKALLAGSTAALLAAGAAYAQDAAQPAPPPPATASQTPQPQTQPAAPAAEFSEAQVEAFADILVSFNRIAAEHAASGATTQAGEDPQAKAKMAAVVENSGLSFEDYNAMAAKLRADDDFNRRVAQHIPDKAATDGGG